jgi:hypothetical protein
MELYEIDALLSDTSRRLGREPHPVTPEVLLTSSRDPSIRRNQRNKQQADRYMGDVRSYLEKVQRGRSVRSVDPLQPALSHEAETIRQADSVDKANRFGTRTIR